LRLIFWCWDCRHQARAKDLGDLVGGQPPQAEFTVLPQANAYAMIGRRAVAAGIAIKLGNHSVRATGITPYLKNGALERILVDFGLRRRIALLVATYLALPVALAASDLVAIVPSRTARQIAATAEIERSCHCRSISR
jgi:hypothetical protein